MKKYLVTITAGILVAGSVYAWQILAIPQGGTGTATTPAQYEILQGNASSGYDLTATPTFTAINATSTNIDNLLVYNNATTTGHFEADSTLYVKDSKVGIGGQTPTSLVDIQQACDTILCGLEVTNSGVGRSAFLWADSSNIVRLSSGATEAGNLAINGAGTGNVGVGTVSIDTAFHVYDAGADAVMKVQRGADNDAAVQYTNTAGSMYAGLGSTEDFVISGQADLSGDPMFVVDPSGFIGVGQHNPSFMVDVDGGSRSDNLLRLGSDTGDGGGVRRLEVLATSTAQYSIRGTGSSVTYALDFVNPSSGAFNVNFPDGWVGIGIPQGNQVADSPLQVRESSTATGSTGGLTVTQASTGDAMIHLELEGTRYITIGIDNSDSDAFVMSHSSTLGTSNMMRVSTGGVLSTVTGLPTPIPIRVETAHFTGVTTTAATLDSSSARRKMLFDAGTDECVRYDLPIVPYTYSTELTPKLDVVFSMASATTNNVALQVYVMAQTAADAADIDTDSFATVNTATVAVPAAAGRTQSSTITLTNNDSLTDADFAQVQICRDADATADNATGDMELRGLLFYYE